MLKPYLLLTGIPRSGTTLIASLVDGLEDTLCLNEPSRYYNWAVHCRDRREFVARCTADLRNIRAALVNGGTVLDGRQSDGAIPCNYFDETGRRLRLDPVAVGRPASGDRLLLAVKHNEPLTAVLPELCELEDIQVVCIVRHPVPTILSWRSRHLPLASGNLSVGYRLWPEATHIRDAGGCICQMQAKIFELYCTRYWENRHRIEVIKYEDVVENPKLLERLTGRKLLGDYQLSTHNRKRSMLAGDESLSKLKAIMAKHFRNAYHFYPNLEHW